MNSTISLQLMFPGSNNPVRDTDTYPVGDTSMSCARIQQVDGELPPVA
jgi:hypothetical protein